MLVPKNEIKLMQFLGSAPRQSQEEASEASLRTMTSSLCLTTSPLTSQGCSPHCPHHRKVMVFLVSQECQVWSGHHASVQAFSIPWTSHSNQGKSQFSLETVSSTSSPKKPFPNVSIYTLSFLSKLFSRT